MSVHDLTDLPTEAADLFPFTVEVHDADHVILASMTIREGDAPPSPGDWDFERSNHMVIAWGNGDRDVHPFIDRALLPPSARPMGDSQVMYFDPRYCR